MGDKSGIEWTDATWNPVRGCDKVSPGCKHCYAETFAERWRGIPGHAYEQGFDLRLVPEKLGVPLRWQRPRQIFVNSMSDLFHVGVPMEFIAAVFGVMAATPRHTYQVLTKRADRMLEFFGHTFGLEDTQTTIARDAEERHRVIWDSRGSDPSKYGMLPGQGANIRIKDRRPWSWPLSNVILGVSVEDRKYGLPRVDVLRKVPAVCRFLSIEPLLEDLGEIDLAGIGWVIVGGESGPGARSMDPVWVRSIRDQCVAAGVPFFFKQWGGVRKKILGRVLDGRTWDEMPMIGGASCG